MRKGFYPTNKKNTLHSADILEISWHSVVTESTEVLDLGIPWRVFTSPSLGQLTLAVSNSFLSNK